MAFFYIFTLHINLLSNGWPHFHVASLFLPTMAKAASKKGTISKIQHKKVITSPAKEPEKAVEEIIAKPVSFNVGDVIKMPIDKISGKKEVYILRGQSATITKVMGEVLLFKNNHNGATFTLNKKELL